MKYFFILGRNPELSRAEIISYLDARNIEFKQILIEKNILILEIKLNLIIEISDFGGVVMFGRILFSGSKSEILNFIQESELVPEDKFTFNIVGNYDIEQELYEKFKKENRKSMLRHGRGEIKMQDGETIEIPNADIHFFCFKQNNIHFGIVEQVFSSKEVKERDMNKPIRREELAISPRLAKILINLSYVKEGQTLLDPFCGIGGILQEAILKNIDVIGIDLDKKAIENAKENLDWLKNKYKARANYEVIEGDARKTPELNFNGIATEPNLGKLTRKKLNNIDAISFIKQFENSIIPILQRLRRVKKENAKIAITFPCIRNFSVNITRIINETGLSLYKSDMLAFPIKEFRKDQFVSREIFVFV